jgi:hypothetical protein
MSTAPLSPAPVGFADLLADVAMAVDPVSPALAKLFREDADAACHGEFNPTTVGLTIEVLARRAEATDDDRLASVALHLRCALLNRDDADRLAQSVRNARHHMHMSR